MYTHAKELDPGNSRDLGKHTIGETDAFVIVASSPHWDIACARDVFLRSYTRPN